MSTAPDCDTPSEPQTVALHDWLTARPSGPLRFKFFLTGVIFPSICLTSLAAGIEPTPGDEYWQSGKFDVYAAMLLKWHSVLPFLPLIVFSMISLAFWSLRPESSRHGWVRIGIYAGVPLAIQFLVLILVTTSILTLVGAAVVGPTLFLLTHLAFKLELARRLRRFTIWGVMILTTVVALMVAGIGYYTRNGGGTSLLEIAFLPYLFILMASPTLNAVTYTRSAIKIWSQAGSEPQSSTWGAGSLVTVGWVAAWKFAVENMLLEYSKLPPQPPNCYVSMVAARGHSRLVGSQPVRWRSQQIWVNTQMRRLKFLELTLQAIAPQVQRAVRHRYDQFGPRLSRLMCRRKWSADVAYLLLKPLEWLAWAIQCGLHIDPQQLETIYRPTASTSRDSGCT